MPTLFTPLQVGDLLLPNRIVMAPLTRVRAGATHIPNDMMVDYYSQRASSGLSMTECTMVDSHACAGGSDGYSDYPALAG
jgi:N-ethylmaleimide reductase